jgi:cobalt-precorrin 5A hydrolase/precorrin-3B C17-methyltransferase
MKPAVVTFRPATADLAARIAAAAGGDVHRCGPEGAPAGGLLPRLFAEGTPIVGICAAGILIRLLAQVLADKHAEPPVLAVSADGAHVVPLLGGHHGANRLAREIAAATGGTAALTTASDSRFARGLDEPPEGWVLANPEAAKPAMAAVLAGAGVTLDGEAPWLAEAGYPIATEGAVRVIATIERRDQTTALTYHPQVLVAGVGCARGADAAEVIALIAATLSAANLSPLSLAAVGSIDIKADEAALHAAAAHFGVPLRLFAAADLAAERDRLLNPSAVVEAETGTPGVAEAVALKAGRLLVGKHKTANATCAIGLAPAPLGVTAFGRAPGRLHVVGIGPGNAGQRTASAVAALETSSDWVGYGLYLDLAADLRHGQAEHRFPLGAETERCRRALELAGHGRTVALVCSGDPAIYAMAALVMELLDGAELSDAARRVALEIHPGISAVQAASAAAGALIGHDFCCISLSDLLTDRATILRRLEAAATGDFVVALYNPRSARRTTLIETARDLFRKHRPPETPVIIAANLGRPAATTTVTSLAGFDVTQVDMLSVVLIGASTSRAFRRGDGRLVAYTPRGYARKRAEAAE